MNHKKRKNCICFFGTYESSFPRSITLKEACRHLNIKVMECHSPFWEKKREKLEFFSAISMIKTVFQLIFIYMGLAIRYIQLEDHDAVVVGYNGYFDMPLAKLLSKIRKKPLIFTPVFPLYETLVEDRKYLDKLTLKAKVIHLIDRLSCTLADHIIIETKTYMNYYCREFRIPEEKFTKISLGADETNFLPDERGGQRNDPHHLKILFYGKFIPLQGISYIIKAAKLLEIHNEIEFEIIGSGQLSEEIKDLAKKLNTQNVSFIDWVDYRDLPDHIQNADICLGIFGHTKKAQRGIPIKVYEALAMKKPVITGDTPAAREILQHRINSLLCDTANPRAIAEAVLLLKENENLRKNIAEAGFSLYQDSLSSVRIAEEFEKVLEKCLH